MSNDWHYVTEEKETGICPSHGRVWYLRMERERGK